MELLSVYLGLALLGPLFAWLERRARARPPADARARGRRAAWWLITPIVTGVLARLCVFGALSLLARALGFGPDGWSLIDARAGSPAATLPVPLAFPAALVLADGLGYLSHRLRHTRALWFLHAVHHAPVDLRALDAAQLHPLDEVLDELLIGPPLLVLGFSFSVYAAIGPFLVLHTLLTHADLPWRFGPLGRVLVSPALHRRHHARDLPAANFAGVFAFWDVLFGTWTAPQPGAATGVPAGDAMPDRVLEQLAYPLRRAALALRPRV